MTSPVLRISGVRATGAPGKRTNGNTASLTAQIRRRDFAREAELRQLFPSHDARGQLGQRHGDGLRDKGDGARGARVDFEHIQLVVLDGELDVHESNDFQFAREGVGGLPHFVKHRGLERVRRQHHRGIAGVHAGEFNVLAASRR